MWKLPMRKQENVAKKNKRQNIDPDDIPSSKGGIGMGEGVVELLAMFTIPNSKF